MIRKKPHPFRYIFSFCAILVLGMFCKHILILRGSYIPWDAKDREFAHEIRQNLKAVGDSVLVYDLYKSDWIEVCVNPVGTNIPLPQKYQILDDKETYATGHVGGIYFLFAPNKIQYFRMPRNEVYVAMKSDSCVERKDARLLVIGDHNDRKMSHPKIDLPADYLEVILVKQSKEK